MERASVIPYARRKEIGAVELELIEAAEPDSFFDPASLDLAWFNWGLHRGKIKLLDYGL